MGFSPPIPVTYNGDDYVTVGGVVLEETQSNSKDLEKLGANIEAVEVESIKDKLLSYGLSNDRTEKVARLANSYKKILNKRGLNSREKNMFTKELLGLSFDEAAAEMVEDYEGLIERAADRNETSPEAIKELINTMM